MKGQRTPSGFKVGPVEVSNAFGDDKKGWVTLIVKTAKHPRGLQVYVTKTGKVRIFGERNEWHPKAWA